VIGDRPYKLNTEYPLPVIFWPKLTHGPRSSRTVSFATAALLIDLYERFDYVILQGRLKTDDSKSL